MEVKKEVSLCQFRRICLCIELSPRLFFCSRDRLTRKCRLIDLSLSKVFVHSSYGFLYSIATKCLRTLSGLFSLNLIDQSSCKMDLVLASVVRIRYYDWSIRLGENRPDRVLKHMATMLSFITLDYYAVRRVTSCDTVVSMIYFSVVYRTSQDFSAHSNS